MLELPCADHNTRDSFLKWLEYFSAFVREVDYDGARPLFHKEILAFGTHRDVIASLDQWVSSQWDNVWPRTADFQFDLPNTQVLISSDNSMACVVSPWTSTGFHRDGSRFDRPGRATLIFHRTQGVSADDDDQFAKTGNDQFSGWICTHSHMSLNRGVPDRSYADRPVKSRLDI